MFTPELLDSSIFSWVILPILIFLSRILDQSIGTLRLIFVSKGFKILAPVLGFFEVVIWLVAVSQIMKHLDNVMCYVAYGGGFAMGNYIGIILDERMSIGTVLVRIVPKSDTGDLIAHLRGSGFGVTSMNAEGMSGPVKIIFSIINRKDLSRYVALIKEHNPQEFFTIEDVKTVSEGYFSRDKRTRSAFGVLNPFARKSK
ncbi:MAG: DUF2179 domain-containing protein [Bacteroidota bacterium]